MASLVQISLYQLQIILTMRIMWNNCLINTDTECSFASTKLVYSITVTADASKLDNIYIKIAQTLLYGKIESEEYNNINFCCYIRSILLMIRRPRI